MKTTIGGIDVGSENVRRALMYSIGDALCWQIMFVLVENFAVAAALSLKAPALAISVVGSLPIFIGSLAQAFALRMVNPAGPRKPYVVLGTRLQAVCIIMAACSGLLPHPASIIVFITAFALYVISARLFDNLWQTWYADLVPPCFMGRHSAWRSTLLAIVGLSTSICVGLLARKYNNDNAPWLFFFIIFMVAAAARFGSSWMLVRQYEPLKQFPLKRFSFKQIKLPKQLIVFTAAMALFNGAATMSGPFFSVWYLKDLTFNYLSLAVSSACATLGTLLALRFWGALTDRIGAARVLMISGLCAAIAPLPYLVLHETWQIWLLNFYAGAVWGGLGNASFKYLIQSLDKDRPEQTLTVFNIIQGSALFVFGLLGGFLATRLPVLFDWRLQTLFLLSATMRLIVWATLILKIRDAAPPIDIKSAVRRKFAEL